MDMAIVCCIFRRGSTAAVSQLLVIISDGRGIFHEGKEKVIQV